MKTLTKKQEQILFSLFKRNEDMMDKCILVKIKEAKKYYEEKGVIIFENHGVKFAVLFGRNLKTSTICHY